MRTADHRRRQRERALRREGGRQADAAARAEKRRAGELDTEIDFDEPRACTSFRFSPLGRFATVEVERFMAEVRKEGYAVVDFTCLHEHMPEGMTQRLRVIAWGPRGDSVTAQSMISNRDWGLAQRVTIQLPGMESLACVLVMSTLKEFRRQLPAEWLRTPEELAIMAQHPAWRKA